MISFSMTPFRFADAVWLAHGAFYILKPKEAEEPPEKLFRPAPEGFGERLESVWMSTLHEGKPETRKDVLVDGKPLAIVRFGHAVVEERFALAVQALHGVDVRWMSSTWWGDVFALNGGTVVAVVSSYPPKAIGQA